jgi:hypothetical protein
MFGYVHIFFSFIVICIHLKVVTQQMMFISSHVHELIKTIETIEKKSWPINERGTIILIVHFINFYFCGKKI